MLIAGESHKCYASLEGRRGIVVEYLLAAAAVVYILYLIIRHISLYPERKRRREQSAMIEEILGGFDVQSEKDKIIKVLKENLPEGYWCGRRGCNGVLLKLGSYYVCSNCHNLRTTIQKLRFPQ